VFSTTIIFGHALYGYRNWWARFGSIFGLLLGKFEYHEFASTNENLGPLFFFAFNVIVNWIVMNVFISILNDTFAAVQAELLAKENEYDLLEYMSRQIKGLMGFESVNNEMLMDDDDSPSESTVHHEDNTPDGSISGRKSVTSMYSMEKLSRKSPDNSRFVADIEMTESEVHEMALKFAKALNVIYFAHSDATKQKMWEIHKMRTERQAHERNKKKKEVEEMENSIKTATDIILQPGECEESRPDGKKEKKGKKKKGWEVIREYTATTK